MNVKQKFRVLFLKASLSPMTATMIRWLWEARRRVLRRPHVVSVFLQLDDPYSYLLGHYLPELAAYYDIELRLYLSEAQGGAYRPAPEMLAEYAIDDCARLAAALGIPFLDKGATPPVEHRLSMLDTIAAYRDKPEFDKELLHSLSVYWRGDAEAAARRIVSEDVKIDGDAVIRESQDQQTRLGHYDSAMVHYGGEWYWGVDRLHHLLNRLDSLGAANPGTTSPLLNSLREFTRYSLPVTPPVAARGLPPIELFFSFRSPYSYLVLSRTFDIADAFGLKLILRPVLPMVMRGMSVPRDKLLYIVRDATREAARLGIEFGKIADPVGAGVDRCLAVFQYAAIEKRDRDFVLNAGEAIWARGVDVASDIGMRKVTGKTGLFWPDVKRAMAIDDWRTTVEENRESMMASGSWGVPTIRMGDFVAWGQDRDWLLLRHIEDLCDTGDGILV